MYGAHNKALLLLYCWSSAVSLCIDASDRHGPRHTDSSAGVCVIKNGPWYDESHCLTEIKSHSFKSLTYLETMSSLGKWGNKTRSYSGGVASFTVTPKRVQSSHGCCHDAGLSRKHYFFFYGCAEGGSEQWEGRFDKHHVLRSIYPRAIKEGSGHNDVWRTGAVVGGSW